MTRKYVIRSMHRIQNHWYSVKPTSIVYSIHNRFTMTITIKATTQQQLKMHT